MADTGHKVLIVDDDEVVRSLLKKICSQMGSEVVAVSNATDALKHLKSEKYSLVIADLIMPVSDGWSFLDKIRENPETRDTPVIIMTGLSLSDDEKTRICSKCKAVVSKHDFKINEFKNIIGEFIKG